MSEFKKIVKGSLLVFISMTLAYLFGYLSKVVLARYLGPSQLGLYALSLTVLYIFTSFAISGFGTSLTYFYSKERRKKEFVSTIFLTSFLILLIISITILMFPNLLHILFNNENLISLAWLISIFILFYGLTRISFSVLRGQERAGMYALFNLSIPTLYLIALLFLKVRLAYHALLLYVLVYILIGSVVILKFIKNNLTKPNFSLLKKVFPFTVVLFLVEILFQFRRWTDVWMLSWLSNLSNIGFYSVAISTAFAFNAVLLAFNFLYLPVSTRLLNQNKLHELRRIYNKICFLITLVIAPFCVLLFVFASQFIRIVFGKTYLASVFPFRILTLAVLINSMFGPNWTNLVAKGEKKILVFLAIFTLLLNVILNYFMIPMWDIVGAATATAISIISWNILTSYILWIKQRMTPFSKDMIKSLVISVSLVIPLVFLSILYNFSLIYAALLSVVYLGAYVFFINMHVIRIKEIFNYLLSIS